VSFELVHPTQESADACEARSAHGLAPIDPRYAAIFESRWGLPVLAAPFVAVLGVNEGLRCASVLMTMLGGLAAYATLLILHLRRDVAALGQAFYYASPIGAWGSYGLTDGPSATLSMGILLGAMLVVRHRYRLGISLVSASILAGCFVRYSSFLIICLAILAASLLSLLIDRQSRTPMLTLLGLVSTGVVALATTARMLAWPGIGETLQDTFTGHFTRPDVADPWGKLVGLNSEYWTQWSQEQLRNPWLLIAVAVGSVMLLRRHGTFGRIGVAVAMTGFLNQVAHPVDNQGDRLMIQVWVAAAIGVPLLWRHGDETPDQDRCRLGPAGPSETGPSSSKPRRMGCSPATSSPSRPSASSASSSSSWSRRRRRSQ
jgi:hypothetical protein